MPKWKILGSVEHFAHNFDWSIAGNMQGNSPNILSELTWKDLKGPQINIEINRVINSRIDFGLSLSRHSINNGNGSDIDYLKDNRVDPFFDKSFLSNKGRLSNYLLTVAYKWPTKKQLKIKTFLCPNFFEQKLFILDFPNEIRNPPLNSTYKNKWKGVVLGIEAAYQLKKIRFELNTATGYYAYVGKGNWNINPKFKHPLSFKQLSNGYKYSFGIETNFRLYRNIEIFMSVQQQYLATFAGTDEAYLSDGNIPKTRFNGARGKSLGLASGIAVGL